MQNHLIRCCLGLRSPLALQFRSELKTFLCVSKFFFHGGLKQPYGGNPTSRHILFQSSSRASTSLTSHMAIWSDLPFKICDHILLFFCLITVRAADEVSSDVSNQPQTPAHLQDFSSALQVCHYFRNRITNTKIDRETPISILQQMQSASVQNIVDPVLVGLRSRMTEAEKWNLRSLIRCVNVFWKNPLVISEFDLLEDLFNSLTPRDRTILIPRLRDWICSLARSSETSKSRLEIRVRAKPYDRGKEGSNDVDPGFPVTLNCTTYSHMSGHELQIFSVE